MANFKYKFESVKNVKKTIEKKVQKELMEIEFKIQKLNDEINNLITQKETYSLEIKNRNNLKVRDLYFYQDYENFLDAKIKRKRKEVVKLSKEKKAKIEELIQKSKETKMFEKLEEIYKLDYINEQKKLEQKELDEVAAKKFGRGKLL